MELDEKSIDEQEIQQAFYKFRVAYNLYGKKYNAGGVSFNEVSDLQDRLFENMTKTKFTNSYQRWNQDDDSCLLKMWNAGASMKVIEQVLSRSEKACNSRISRLRHDKLLESIPNFFDELSAKLDIDPRLLQNAVDVILDNKNYEEFRKRVDVNVSKNVDSKVIDLGRVVGK